MSPASGIGQGSRELVEVVSGAAYPQGNSLADSALRDHDVMFLHVAALYIERTRTLTPSLSVCHLLF